MKSATWREKDLELGLILFRSSLNAHGWSNYCIQSERLDEFCKNPIAALDLVRAMRSVANDIEERYETKKSEAKETRMADAHRGDGNGEGDSQATQTNQATQIPEGLVKCSRCGWYHEPNVKL